MSFWVHAWCKATVADVTPSNLSAGIAERLSELTRFFLVDSPASPQDVLEQLRIEDLSNDGTFREFKMHYRPDSSTFIHIRRDGSLDSVGMHWKRSMRVFSSSVASRKLSRFGSNSPPHVSGCPFASRWTMLNPWVFRYLLERRRI